MPKVSIVIPSYNRADYIPATLDSIIKQSFKDWELIFIDDGSTDTTESILANYISQDSRIKYFKQSNSERAVARSYGISLASGDYICLVDSDDLWYPDKLEKQLTIMYANPDTILCYAAVDRIDLDGKPAKSAPRQYQGYSGDVYEELLKRNFIPSVTPMIRAEFASKAAPQVTEFIPYEDWDFWLRLSRMGKFYHINEPLGAYRLHPGQSVQNVKAEKIEEVTLKVLDANTNDSSLISKEAYSLAYLRLAYWYIVSGKLNLARSKLYKALQLSYARLGDYRWYGLLVASILAYISPSLIKKLLGSFH